MYGSMSYFVARRCYGKGLMKIRRIIGVDKDFFLVLFWSIDGILKVNFIWRLFFFFFFLVFFLFVKLSFAFSLSFFSLSFIFSFV